MTRRITTGVRALDRELDGGIPSGSLVALVADPASQAELLVARFVARQETVYLSSERAPTAVTTALQTRKGPTDGLAVTKLDGDAPAFDAIDHLDALPEEALVVVDPVESLERAGSGQYRAFLETFRSKLVQTDSVGLLHALKHDQTPAQRHRTKYMSDVVFDLATETTDDAVENRLYVPKFRNGSALTDAIRLELTDDVDVDTSRDIA